MILIVPICYRMNKQVFIYTWLKLVIQYCIATSKWFSIHADVNHFSLLTAISRCMRGLFRALQNPHRYQTPEI